MFAFIQISDMEASTANSFLFEDWTEITPGDLEFKYSGKKQKEIIV